MDVCQKAETQKYAIRTMGGIRPINKQFDSVPQELINRQDDNEATLNNIAI